MRLPLRFASYGLPGLPRQTNSIYTRNLLELQYPNPYLRVKANAQTLVDGAGVRWDEESARFPRLTIGTPTLGTTFLEIPANGLWTVEGQAEVLGARTGGFAQWELKKISGEGSTGIFREGVIYTTRGARVALSATVPLSAGDRIVLSIRHDSTAPLDLTLTTSEDLTWLSIAGVGTR